MIIELRRSVIAGDLCPCVVFDKLLQLLRFGCSYQAIADTTCSATTIRNGRDQWIRLGLFARLKQIALESYDRIVGLVRVQIAIDGSITKAPRRRRGRRTLTGRPRQAGPETLCLYSDNRRVRPTGRMILYHLGELTLRIGTSAIADQPMVQITRGVQLHLLELLGIESGHRTEPVTREGRPADIPGSPAPDAVRHVLRPPRG